MEERNEQVITHEMRMERLEERRASLMDIMTTEDFATFYGLDERQVIYHIRKGRIPAYGVGKGRYLISLRQLEKYISTHNTYIGKVLD